MGTETTLAQVLQDGYGFDDDALILGRPLDPALSQPQNDHYVQVPLRMLNRHGLVAGATGTGKTKTLQVMAEQLSRAGIPVFLADLKGDLTGLAVEGTSNQHIDARMGGMDLPWHPESFPVELLSISGEVGTPLRVPLSSFGPLLLAKVMDCTETQESVLQVIFKYADEAQLALLDLVDLIEVLRFLTTDEGKQLQSEYGGMSTQTVNVLLRKAMELQTQGGDTFFGEPEFDVADLQRTEDGKGVISIMNLVDVQTKPRIFSTFMMWLLAEIYESSPEVGDQPAPKLVFFFDEAHLLFDGASKTLRESIELTVRMIRSKGIGVFFVTQQPRDVPDNVLSQLGTGVVHGPGRCRGGREAHGREPAPGALRRAGRPGVRGGAAGPARRGPCRRGRGARTCQGGGRGAGQAREGARGQDQGGQPVVVAVHRAPVDPCHADRADDLQRRVQHRPRGGPVADPRRARQPRPLRRPWWWCVARCGERERRRAVGSVHACRRGSCLSPTRRR